MDSTRELKKQNGKKSEKISNLKERNKQFRQESKRINKQNRQLKERNQQIQEENQHLQEQSQQLQDSVIERRKNALREIRTEINNHPNWQRRCNGVRSALTFFSNANVDQDNLDNLNDNQIDQLARDIKDTFDRRLHRHVHRTEEVHDFYIESIAKIGMV